MPVAEGCEKILLWLDEARKASGLAYQAIDWSESAEWCLSKGLVRHRTSGFFSIIGVRARSNLACLDGLEQPMILQPEIGILGFIVRRREGEAEILMQAKTEPGNIGGTQLAPSVQATISNYTRRHGGAPTPYLERFLSPHEDVRADCVQSEQGTRFFDKFNRNATVSVGPDQCAPVSPNWCWFSVADVLPLLRHDFVINTDARSVLMCCDWSALAEDGVRPFRRWQGSGAFGERLLSSFEAEDDAAETPSATISALLEEHRRNTLITIERVALEQLTTWQFTAAAIVPANAGPFRVPLLKVSTNDREVNAWDQPFMANLHEEAVILFCQQRKGNLHFRLSASPEIGFRDRVQLGPSVQTGNPGMDNGYLTDLARSADEFACVADMRQSDEGGRFFQSVTRYRIIELPEQLDVQVGHNGVWATLGQVYQMLKQPGLLTNEARSALSLLLVDV